DDGLVLIFLPRRPHLQSAVILILIDAAITQADRLDPGGVSRLGGDGQWLFRRGARHWLAREGWRLVVIARRRLAGQEARNQRIIFRGGREGTLPLQLQRLRAPFYFDPPLLSITRHTP